MTARSRFAALLAVAATALAGCVSDDEVRDACRPHRGVNAVEGGRIAKNVVCRDGYFRVVR